MTHRWFAVSLKRVLDGREGGGAGLAMVEGDDAGNDIYKQLGARVPGSRAGCMGRSYSATTNTTVQYTHFLIWPGTG